jgi:hypothetical protein
VSDRKRKVVATHSTYYVCDVHGWDFTNVDDDVCPVCLGETAERERIVKLLQSLLTKEQKSYKQRTWIVQGLPVAIAAIKGENNG